jgi:hypothetical protein
MPRFWAPPEPPELPPLDPPELPPLEPPELPPPLELDCTVQGATMIVVTPLLLGSTSWFCGALEPLDEPDEPDADAAWVLAPPGVNRMVLEGGGCAPPDELDPPLDPPGGMQGCTATVCVRPPCGTTI